MKILNFLLISSLFLLAFSLSAFEILDPDTLNYLAYGRYIAQNGLPSGCVFSFPLTSCSTVLPEWLLYLFLFRLHSLFSWSGLVFLQVLIVLTLVSIILFFHLKNKVSPISVTILMVVSLLVAQERFMLRADLLSLLLTAAIYILVSALNGQKKYNLKNARLLLTAASILLVQILFSNVHGSFLITFLIIASFLLPMLVRKFAGFFKKLPLKNNPLLDWKIKLFFCLLSGTMIVSSINPFGIQSLIWSVRHLVAANQEIIKTISEYESPFAASNLNTRLSLTLYAWLIPSVFLVLLFNLRKLRLADVLILTGFLILSLNAVRFISYFALGVALILPPLLDNCRKAIRNFLTLKTAFMRRINSYVILFSFAVKIGFIIFMLSLAKSVITNDFYRHDNQTRRFGFGISEISYPQKAADFVLKNRLEGNLFNTYKFGAYLNWRLYPQYKTFIHGSVLDPTVPETLTFYERYRRINQQLEPYQPLAEEYNINFFLLDHTNPLNKNLVVALYRDPDWALVYLDNLTALYLKREEKNQPVISAYEITAANISQAGSAIHFKRKRDESIIRNSIGTFMSHLELFEQAAGEYQKAIDIDPEDYADYINLANTNRKLGNKELAVSLYREAIELRPGFAPAYFNLANFYLENKKYDLAKTNYEMTLKINRKYPLAHYNLGVIHEIQGERQTAAKLYAKELKIQPQYQPAQTGLTRISQY
ncbi:MAG: hypothetical protein UV73_C0016G0004 [Candidatus Gottesmanbacteria bacterium GW2011_GWA2_43_14]|uniref:Uncharacterized protein n=1 Tax=Candidatus Gottesmanbacteria bacterium GW2011_GWA2_43_14 TaxID=1618443 RepID=A0A0G1G9B3_9BACT|nr:MAG: hypothetical protein UV73_C0016G0004 [Candidatus Gottesmanbacteria bacterium GW2011_GWA2_43_14]